MASVNKVIIVGNLGADPETRYMPSGDAVTNIRVATSDKWKDKASGEMKEATEWHRIAFYGRLAEVAGEYLKKGSRASGRTRTATTAIAPRFAPTRCRCSAGARGAANRAPRVPARRVARVPGQRARPPRSRPASSTTWRTTFPFEGA